MKNKIYIALFVLGAFVLTSCNDKSTPNYQYMPNMYEEVGYGTYSKAEIFPNGMEAMLPAEGSVSRGWMPYDYPDSFEGYTAAKENLKNPVVYTEDNLNEGKALYTIYCAICHGDKGDGKGTLVQREKILGVPAYNDAGRAITEGSVYHVMYYGINTMGSYASQTTEKELWLIDHYVMDLKDQLNGKDKRPFEDKAVDTDVDVMNEVDNVQDAQTTEIEE